MAAININETTYLRDKFGPKDTFEERQTRFRTAGIEAIRAGAEILKSKPSLRGPDRFFSVISSLAERRQKIAHEEGTKDAAEFGQPTYLDTDSNFIRTILFGIYSEANKIALSEFKSLLHTMRHGDKIQSSKRVEETVLGRKFFCQVQILKSEEAEKLVHFDPTEILNKYPEMKLSEILHKLQKETPHIYQQLKLHLYVKETLEKIEGLREIPKSPAPYIAHIELGTEINGKMEVTSELTGEVIAEIFQDPPYEPTLIVHHQDSLQKMGSLQECAALFEKIVDWNPKNSTERELKDQVALLRYLFAHAVPYQRGSAAIGEWLEGVLYLQHGFTCQYRPKYEFESVDLAAMTHLKFSDYLARYHDLVQISL